MKILHFHHSLSTGGIESMIVGLANTMAESEDVDVALMYKPLKSDIFIKKLRSDISVFNLGKVKPGFSLKMPFKVLFFLAKNKYDVVQLHGFFYYYVLAILFLHRRVRFFYTVHNEAPLENTKWDKMILPIKKVFFRWKWLRPITISKESQNSFEKLYGTCANACIYNGIPSPNIDPSKKELVERYKINPTTKVFINPGRICEQKNQLVLVKVFQKLIENGNDVVLLIAGQCQNETILQNLSPYFSDRIKYLGEIDGVTSIMHYCEGMCLSSLWEGLPVVLLESLAVECLPICTPVGGIVNVVESGYNGLLSQDCSPESYYNVMTQYLNLSETEKTQMKLNCKNTFSNYEIHNTVSKYLQTYNIDR